MNDYNRVRDLFYNKDVPIKNISYCLSIPIETVRDYILNKKVSISGKTKTIKKYNICKDCSEIIPYINVRCPSCLILFHRKLFAKCDNIVDY